MMYAQAEYYMRKALMLAQQAFDEGEVPVGAVVVDAHGDIIGRGYNRVIALNDMSAHAEIQALRAAAQHRGNYRLNDCVLYVTLEPCLMCLGAILHARLQRLVYASADPKTGACGGACACHQLQINHHTQVSSGVLAPQATALLKAFFQARR